MKEIHEGKEKLTIIRVDRQVDRQVDKQVDRMVDRHAHTVKRD